MSARLVINTEPLTSDAFKPYGQVIEAQDSSSISANQGTAKRRNWLAKLQNLRPNAQPNMCVFRIKPARMPFEIKLLERHLHSTQAFIPMSCHHSASWKGYLVIVCLNGKDDKPDISTLKCFIAKANQALNYEPGCWHHPMAVLETETDFVCLVWESKEKEDCEEVFFNDHFKGRFPNDTVYVEHGTQ